MWHSGHWQIEKASWQSRGLPRAASIRAAVCCSRKGWDPRGQHGCMPPPLLCRLLCLPAFPSAVALRGSLCLQVASSALADIHWQTGIMDRNRQPAHAGVLAKKATVNPQIHHRGDLIKSDADENDFYKDQFRAMNFVKSSKKISTFVDIYFRGFREISQKWKSRDTWRCLQLAMLIDGVSIGGRQSTVSACMVRQS